MTKVRRIVFLVYEGFELLDLSGPACVFSGVNLGQLRYTLEVVSVDGGLVTTSCQIKIDTIALSTIQLGQDDTLLVVGALSQYQKGPMTNEVILDFLKPAPQLTERYGAIGRGVFLLAAAGLLERKQIATHWYGSERISKQFDSVSVKTGALYVEDDRLWTSAGVATSLDFALAILEADHGPGIRSVMARALVVYRHRPGHLSQISALLEAQSAGGDKFAKLIDWIEESLEQSLKVSQLAARVNMSERTFFRKFSSEIGMSPSKYVESRRLERAKNYLDAGQSIKEVCISLGFKSPSAFRSAFKACYGVLPSSHDDLHRESGRL